MKNILVGYKVHVGRFIDKTHDTIKYALVSYNYVHYI